MKIHLLNENCSKNLCIPSENMKNISKCNKEVSEWEITTITKEVTCNVCIKMINKDIL